MKNNKGFARMFIILIIIALGGITYAVVPKSVLKGFLERGDKPTEEQFSNTLDSSLNLEDDADRTGSEAKAPTKAYVAGDTVVKSDSIYQAKVLSQPQTEFKLDAAQPVTFRWALMSQPQGSVTYRMKVWQLMQGQSGSQAMKTNPPIITRDVADITEVTINNLYTGPCRPPYLCDFIWSVEALTTGGTKTGTSEPTMLQATQATTPAESKGTSDGTHY
jgi:hypothetical protein